MKPIFLKIANFGPFTTAQTIDFTRFDHEALLLIHGPTGAGKTTIFDAITYALYGKTTSGRAVMRSDFADLSSTMEVEFVFAVKSIYYKSQRLDIGEKNQTKQFFGKVDSLTYNYLENQTVLTKIREIEEEAKRIIGFSADQFKQVIVLPQGKFEAVLKGNNEMRGTLLSQIFDNDFYKKMTNELSDRYKKDEEEYNKIKNKKENILAEFEQENIEDLLFKADEMKQNFIAQERIKVEKQKAKENKQRLQETAKRVAEDFEQLAQIQRKIEVAKTQQATIEQKEIQVRTAKKAEVFVQLINRGKEIHQETQTIKNQISDFYTEIEEINKKFESLKVLQQQHPVQRAKATQLRIEAEQYSKKHLALNALIKKEESVQLLVKEIKKREIDLVKTENDLRVIDAKQQILQDLQSQKEQILQTLFTLEKNATQLVQDKVIFLNIAEVSKKVSEKNEKIKKLKAELITLENQRNTQSDLLNVIRKSILGAQAYILASKLTQGEPCPVCGSKEHPQKAQNQLHIYTEKEEIEAKSALDASEKAYTEVFNSHQMLKVQVEEHLKRISEGQNMVSAYKDAQAFEEIARANETEMKQTERKKTEIEQKILTVQTEIKQKEHLQTLLDQASRSLGQIKSEHQATLGEIKALKENLGNDATQTPLFFEKAAQQAVAQAQQIEETVSKEENLYTTTSNRKHSAQASLLEKEKRQTALQKEHVHLKIQFDQLLERQGFQDREALKPALKLFESGEVPALERAIAEFRKEEINLKAQEEGLLKRLKDEQKPDLEQIAKDLKQISEEFLHEEKKTQEAFAQLKSLEKAVVELKKLQIEIDKAGPKYERLKELSHIANGKEAPRIKFDAFVLRFLLEEVLIFANKRLIGLSSGRYQLSLEEINEQGQGNSYVGLGLRVVDAFSGKRRAVDSLSGGETFLFSLSLALGLADVTTSRSGGITMESMFIDEGFGTLDPHALDTTIATLQNLEGDHRLIGLISHVNELKERIAARIEIIKTERGSSIKTS